MADIKDEIIRKLKNVNSSCKTDNPVLPVREDDKLIIILGEKFDNTFINIFEVDNEEINSKYKIKNVEYDNTIGIKYNFINHDKSIPTIINVQTKFELTCDNIMNVITKSSASLFMADIYIIVKKNCIVKVKDPCAIERGRDYDVIEKTIDNI